MMVEPDLKRESAQFQHKLQRAALLILIAIAIYFIYLASILKVNYYDSFEYFNSAKALLGIGGYYDYSRPPILPLLLTPLMALSRIFTGQWWLTSAPYFYMLIISGLSLWVCYKCFRAWQGAEVAIILTLLLVLDRVFFHFVIFALPDIFSTAIVCGLIYFTYRLTTTEDSINAVLAGLLLGLAVSTKHYLAPFCLVPTIFLLTEWFRFEGPRWQFKPSIKQIKWLGIIAIVSAIITVSLHRITFWLVAEYRYQSLLHILRRVVEKGSTVNEMQTSLTTFSFLHSTYLLAASIGWPLLILAVVGVIICLRRPTRLQLLIFIWLITFLTIFIFIFGRREARYFLQVTPAILFFVGVVITEILNYRQEKWRKLIIAASAVIIFGSVIVGVIKEIVIFSDPIHENNGMQRLADQVMEQTKPNSKLVWFGELLAFIPEKAVLIEDEKYDDPLYFLYGCHGNGMSYFTNRPAYTFLFPLKYPPELTSTLQAGDLLIVAHRRAVTSPPFPPITLHQFSGYSLFVSDPNNENSKDSLRLKVQNGTYGLTLASYDKGVKVFGDNKTPLFAWELLMKSEKTIPLKGYPLFPLPMNVTLSQPVEIDAVEGLIGIPITPAVSTLYY